MNIQTATYIRKPFFVQAAQVSAKNILDVALWCQGDVVAAVPKGQNETVEYIQVHVLRPLNLRQSRAYIGDWVLYAGKNFKVYTQKAFAKTFDPASNTHEHPINVFSEDAIEQTFDTLEEAVCNNTTTTVDGVPCFLYKGHRSGENPTPCRSLKNDDRVVGLTGPELWRLNRLETQAVWEKAQTLWKNLSEEEKNALQDPIYNTQRLV